MNFITYMTVNGRPVRGEVDFFSEQDDAMAHCTMQNALVPKEVHWHLRGLVDVF